MTTTQHSLFDRRKPCPRTGWTVNPPRYPDDTGHVGWKHPHKNSATRLETRGITYVVPMTRRAGKVAMAHFGTATNDAPTVEGAIEKALKGASKGATFGKDNSK